MPTIRGVERSIRKIEHFEVHFIYEHGRDVRGDKRDLPSYRYDRAAPDRWTIAEWRSKRFRQSYPSYAVTVFDGAGEAAHGRMTLAKLRATYD
jgi:hypothetical protein